MLDVSGNLLEHIGYGAFDGVLKSVVDDLGSTLQRAGITLVMAHVVYMLDNMRELDVLRDGLTSIEE